MHNKNTRMPGLGIAFIFTACSAVVLADENADSMRISADDGTDRVISSASTAVNAATNANAFQEDMQRMVASAGVSRAAAASSANGMHSTVLPLSKMKMLVVRKNADGTFTIGHVSDAADTEKFVHAETSATNAGEE